MGVNAMYDSFVSVVSKAISPYMAGLHNNVIPFSQICYHKIIIHSSPIARITPASEQQCRSSPRGDPG